MLEADLVSALPAFSERQRVMGYVWQRCEGAWADGNFTEAQTLHRMYVSFEKMTDEEWEIAYGECECQDR